MTHGAWSTIGCVPAQLCNSLSSHSAIFFLQVHGRIVLLWSMYTRSPCLAHHRCVPSASTAFLNIRKNKLIASYDLEVRVGWTGQLTDGEGKVVGSATGKVHFPHIGGEPGRPGGRRLVVGGRAMHVAGG